MSGQGPLKEHSGRVSISKHLINSVIHCLQHISLFVFLPFSPLLKKLLSVLKVLVRTPNNFDLKTSFKG